MTTTAPRLGPHPVRPTGPPRLLAALPRTLLARAVLIATALGALLAAAGPAAAHAALTGSDPKDGAVVATAPREVTLTFSEQIAMGEGSIRVLDPRGERADTGDVRDLSRGGVVRYGVDLSSGVPDGTYTVAWQAVSADSHPISGAFTFSVGAPSSTEVALSGAQPGGGLVGALYDIARYTAYAGFTLMVGAASFILICWRRGASVRPVQRLVAQGWVTLTAATLAMLLLRGPYTGSGELADVLDLAVLQTVLATKTGAALVSRLLLLGAAALFIAVLFGAYAKQGQGAAPGSEPGEGDEDGGPEDRARAKDLTFGLAVGGGVVASGIAATWALSEHASTGIQTGLAMPLDVLHLLAVACWLGGLVALLTALHRAPAPSIEAAAVRRFSTVAFVSVVVLAATGIYQSWRQVGSWSALTGTSYGRWLLVKIALVVVMLVIARVSRRWTAALADAPEGPSESDEATEAPEEREPAGRIAPDAPATTVTPATSDTTAAPTAPEGAPGAPERAAQLARQQAAVAVARRKKARDADPGRAGLRRSVLAETAVAVVLLAVTTVLTTTEPGRTQETASAAAAGGASDAAPQGPVETKLPFDTGGAQGKGTVRLTLAPAAPGANEMHFWIDGPDGKPLDVPELQVSLTLDAKEIGPLPLAPKRLAAGHWSAPSVQIPMPGAWKMQVTVRTSDIDQTTVDTTVKIG